MAEKTTKFLDVRYHEASGMINFILGNGERVGFEIGKTNAEIQRAALYHGFNQKIRDAAASFSKEKDYAGALANMKGVIESLYSGSWNRKGGATGGAGFTVTDVAEAIARYKKVPVEKALAAVEKATEEQRKAWLENETVKAFATQAKAERMLAAAKPGAGEEGELAGLEGLEEEEEGEETGNGE